VTGAGKFLGGGVGWVKTTVGSRWVARKVVDGSVMGTGRARSVVGSLKTGGFVCRSVVGGCRGVEGLKVDENVTGFGGSRKTVAVGWALWSVVSGADTATGSSRCLSVVGILGEDVLNVGGWVRNKIRVVDRSVVVVVRVLDVIHVDGILCSFPGGLDFNVFCSSYQLSKFLVYSPLGS
jgi:hypothetical protein